jgi:hypothetical protein
MEAPINAFRPIFACIKTIDDFKLLKTTIENVRLQSSYVSFTSRSKMNENKMYLWAMISESELEEIFTFLKLLLYSIVILGALVGNLLVLLVIGLNKSLRSPSNSLFILNLAICDLAIVFSCIWVQMLRTVETNWRLGETFCKLNSFTQMFTIISTVLTLCMISCDRYIGIVHPLKAKKLNKPMYYAAISVIWAISFTVSLPTYLYRSVTEIKWSDFVEQHCDDSGWPTDLKKTDLGCIEMSMKLYKKLYYTFVVLVFFFFPFVVTISAYLLIIRKLRRKDSSDLIASVDGKRQALIADRHTKAIKMLIFLLLTFFVCW